MHYPHLRGFLIAVILAQPHAFANTPAACNTPMSDLEARKFYRDLAGRASEFLKRQQGHTGGIFEEMPVLTPKQQEEFREEIGKCALELQKGRETCWPVKPEASQSIAVAKAMTTTGALLGAMGGLAIAMGPNSMSAYDPGAALAGGLILSILIVPSTAFVGGAGGAGAGMITQLFVNGLCDARKWMLWDKAQQKIDKKVSAIEEKYFWEELRRLGHDVPPDPQARKVWWSQRLAGHAIDGAWVTDPQALKTHTDHFKQFIEDIKNKFPDKNSWEYKTVDAWAQKHDKSGKVPPFFAKHGKQEQVIRNMFETLRDMQELENDLGLREKGIHLKDALLPLKPVQTVRELTADEMWGPDALIGQKKMKPHEAVWGEVHWNTDDENTRAFKAEVEKVKKGDNLLSTELYDNILETNKAGGHVELTVSAPTYARDPKPQLKRPGRAVMDMNFKFVTPEGTSEKKVPIFFDSFRPPHEMLSKERPKWAASLGTQIDSVLKSQRESVNCQQAIEQTLEAGFQLKVPTPKELMER